MSPELERVLREMCKYVGADYGSIDWSDKDDPYYVKYAWARPAELCFTGWLEQELQKRSVREALMGRRALNTKASRKACAQQFVLWYGWRREQ